MSAPAENAGDAIRPLPKRELQATAAFLFETYRREPEFARLYGFTGDRQIAATRPMFRAICASVSRLPEVAYGCYRDGGLVGAVIACPDFRVPIPRLLLLCPLRATAALSWHAYVNLRHRARLERDAKARWRTYFRLARQQTPEEPLLHVLALGVAGSARRRGVARRLLAELETSRWANQMRWLMAETWHAQNVSVYERLGFRVAAHAGRGGVECWTMTRKLGGSEAEPP